MLEAGLSSLSLEPALQRQPPPVVSAVPVPVSYGAYGAPPPPQLLAPSHFQQSATDIMQDPAIMSFRCHSLQKNFFTSLLEKRSAPQREHAALQNMKFLNFFCG
jgi:hypothetical protein